MISSRQSGSELGVAVEGFDLAAAAKEDFQSLKKLVYHERIVVLKGQRLSPAEFISLGRRLGEVEAYYQPMYHHPEHSEIFVSSNVPADGRVVGVPRTGMFWHADYMFKPRPFALTLIYPQVIPQANRGTYFIDMARAYERLPQDLKDAIAGTRCQHSVRRYFKIRPSDVYRPISAILAEIEQETPTITHPTVIRHPVTGEHILYVSEGFAAALEDARGQALPGEVLHRLLEETGQLDPTCQRPHIHLQTFEQDDLLIWDNRALIHRALHTAKPEPATSFRVTVHDEHPFYPGIGG